MPVAPNHSGNLPREFKHCPACGKKGFYRYGGTFIHVGNRVGGLVPGQRCKYCRHRQPDMTDEEYQMRLRQGVLAPILMPPPPVEAMVVVPDRKPNGAFIAVRITQRHEDGEESTVTVPRDTLVELFGMLRMDPTLIPPRRAAWR